MIVDGKQIAEQVYEKARKRVEKLGRAPILSIITCAPNFETLKYLALKQKKAEAVGIDIKIFELEKSNTTEDFIQGIKEAVLVSDGVIVQLPLPETVDTDVVLQSVPSSHDVDALNPDTHALLSPVVGSINEILLSQGIECKEKFVTVIGSGRLVGLPSYHWFQKGGAHVSVVTRDTHDISFYTKNADIVVCGAGVPGLLKPDMIKDGVIILDAGTSEDGGELKGDADPECADKASFFTPVPGGIGPITIAVLLSNVVTCAEKAE
jgi:methylenetetrahydrofolate dehydrogenase (NADP+)/methenyltetrahydrofolate cyclohydrolase